ncbi:hypothetical protein AMS68_005854 [Peltaster fructicola]|uniref:Vps41 beta-propeller domain-containing protein n=1 Tax=Peltaster fructicola TaxID=286661 RepID=A0A6H0Y005_9PEZI|nr:hypothetical protein AMS68_005854 [Peltaster fructicola]
MSAAADAAEDNNSSRPVTRQSADNTPETVQAAIQHTNHDDDEDQTVADQSDDEEEDEDEPKLKYDKLTGRLASVYRNGDSTSAFAVAGNKMVIGTHNGNVHVLALPAMQALRTYKAHSASVTSCSISPTPPPPTLIQRADGSGTTRCPLQHALAATKALAPGQKGKTTAQQPAIVNSPDNAIFIATSSLDGHVCIFSLLDPKDVQLRNFARPVNAVALSPEYKTDRTYLSGGRAGQLVLTIGGKSGVSSDANTNSAAATANGWLGSIGLGSSSGKDTILHQGEGNISTIKWSLSGKWVAWVNEEGIRIMRSHLRLGSEQSENAWKRIPYAPKPHRRIWEEMAGVWRARAQWVENTALEDDTADVVIPSTNGKEDSTPVKKHKKSPIEILVVGWGDMTWILHIEETSGSGAGAAHVGNASIIYKLHFGDCTVAGVSLYSPSVIAILAYKTRAETLKKAATDDAPRKGRAQKHTGLAPQLRLINVHGGEELDVDELPMNRFETLSAQDYDVGSLWIPQPITEKTAREGKGALEGLWEASGGYYAQKMLSSGASVLSRSSSGMDDDGRRGSVSGRANSAYDVTPTTVRSSSEHQYLAEPGLKLFISSPYDCVIGVRRQPTDHLVWLLEHKKYAQAWSLIDKQPGVVDSSVSDQVSVNSGQAGQQQSLAEFLAPDDSTSVRSQQRESSAAANEKLRIGELWLTQLVIAGRWGDAGRIAGKVLQGSSRWEHWILAFADGRHFDEISQYVPGKVVQPPVPSTAYEIILTHYVVSSPSRLRELIEEWDEGLFDASAVISAIRARLASDEVKEGTDEWKHLVEALGHLYLGLANPQEALRCYIRTQNADRAFALLRDERIADALSDNVTGFLTMKIAPSQLRDARLTELDQASDHAVRVLVEEAHKDTVLPDTVVKQLQHKGKLFRPFLYFYLRALWRGHHEERSNVISHRKFDQILDEGHAMVEDFADLAVEVFAEYDREILMEFLEASEVYDYNRAITICDKRKYIPELVLVLSRTGQTKRALWLIIGELGDVTKAITFVKQNPDLWDDLLEYGMDKPRFVRGLLNEVGTSIDPVKVIRRIPAGLEIEGLKSGILNLVQSWEVQLEVSRGVERVLRGEVLQGQATLRQGQRQGIKFEVVHEAADDIEISITPAVTSQDDRDQHATPGYCIGCCERFHDNETQPLLGFACGHVYHLACVLRGNSQTSDSTAYDEIMSSAGYDDLDVEAASSNTRSVGAKVTHAHIIRNAIEHGCQRCATTYN